LPQQVHAVGMVRIERKRLPATDLNLEMASGGEVLKAGGAEPGSEPGASCARRFIGALQPHAKGKFIGDSSDPLLAFASCLARRGANVKSASLAPAAIGRDALLGNPQPPGQFSGLPEHVDRNAAARIPIAADA
jgi:hypothetical protein